tara:strand:- start:547 stop:711 length:165 start_codon:yes stop_codon:yes gene_type:complete
MIIKTKNLTEQIIKDNYIKIIGLLYDYENFFEVINYNMKGNFLKMEEKYLLKKI